MSVGSDTNRISYDVTSASSSALPVDFRFDDTSWLKVYYVGEDSETAQSLVLGTDYTIGGDGTQITGTVTLTSGFRATITSGQLIIARYFDILQSLDLIYNTRLPAELLERALDRITMAIQDRDLSPDEVGARAIVFPLTEPADHSNVLPIPAARVEKFWGGDANGKMAFYNAQEIATLILAYFGGAPTADDVLAAIAAVAPLRLIEPPTEATIGKLGQLAILPYVATGIRVTGMDQTNELCPADIVLPDDGPGASGTRIYLASVTPEVFFTCEYSPGDTLWAIGCFLPDDEFQNFLADPGFFITPNLATWPDSVEVSLVEDVPGRMWVNTAETGNTPVWVEIAGTDELLEKADAIPGSIGRYAGIIAAGPPSVGTFLAGDWIQTQQGEIWSCFEAGTPGKWQTQGQNNYTNRSYFPPKKEWHGISNYPGMGGPDLYMVTNRVYAAPYPLHEDSAIQFIQIKVTAASTDVGCIIKLAIFDDFNGRPGKLLGQSQVAGDSNGVKAAEFDPVIHSKGQLWLAAVAQNCPIAYPGVSALKYGPYEVQGSIINAFVEDYAAWVLYGNSFGGALPVRWSIAPEASLYTDDFPQMAINFASNPERSDPRRYEPDRCPALMPTEEDENVLQEPSAWYHAGRPAGRRYVLFASSCWTAENQKIVWFDGPTVDGPWTRRGSFGNGGRGSIYYEDGILYHYMSPNIATPGGGIICRTGAGPEAFATATPVTVISGIQANNPNMAMQYMNTRVFKIGTNDYGMMFDSSDSVSAPGIWQAGLARATSPLGPFTVQKWPLTSLRQTIAAGAGSPGHCSAGWIKKVGSTWKYFYHGGDSGNLTSDIFYAESTDLENWTPSNLWAVRRNHPYEYDQIADIEIFEDPVSGNTYGFWDSLDNTEPNPFSCIMRSNPRLMTFEI